MKLQHSLDKIWLVRFQISDQLIANALQFNKLLMLNKQLISGLIQFYLEIPNSLILPSCITEFLLHSLSCLLLDKLARVSSRTKHRSCLFAVSGRLPRTNNSQVWFGAHIVQIMCAPWRRGKQLRAKQAAPEGRLALLAIVSSASMGFI